MTSHSYMVFPPKHRLRLFGCFFTLCEPMSRLRRLFEWAEVFLCSKAENKRE